MSGERADRGGRGDRIVLTNLRFEARHGVHEWEQREAQPFEVDIELWMDLAPAGRTDDLARTVDYGRVYDLVRGVLMDRQFRLLEAIAETIAAGAMEAWPIDEVVVRVRKPGVRLNGPLDHAAVEIHRLRDG